MTRFLGKVHTNGAYYRDCKNIEMTQPVMKARYQQLRLTHAIGLLDNIGKRRSCIQAIYPEPQKSWLTIKALAPCDELVHIPVESQESVLQK